MYNFLVSTLFFVIKKDIIVFPTGHFVSLVSYSFNKAVALKRVKRRKREKLNGYS